MRRDNTVIITAERTTVGKLLGDEVGNTVLGTLSDPKKISPISGTHKDAVTNRLVPVRGTQYIF